MSKVALCVSSTCRQNKRGITYLVKRMTEVNFAMEAKTKTLESSLTVPSVQELSLQSPHKVPPRYIRDNDDDDFCTFPSDDPSLIIPLIDKAKLVNADAQQDELRKLHLACKHWGVFQVLYKLR